MRSNERIGSVEDIARYLRTYSSRRLSRRVVFSPMKTGTGVLVTRLPRDTDMIGFKVAMWPRRRTVKCQLPLRPSRTLPRSAGVKLLNTRRYSLAKPSLDDEITTGDTDIHNKHAGGLVADLP